MSISEITKIVQSEFAKKQALAETLAKENLDKAMANPDFAKLESDERKLSLELAKAKISKQKDVKEISKSLEKTRQDKRKVLEKMGFSEQMLKPNFECEICRDSGIINGELCKCFKKRRTQLLIKEFGLNENELESFDNLNPSLCGDEKQAETLEKLSNHLQSWCQKYPNVKKNNLLLCGTTGVGKTFLTKCMAKELLKKDVSVCFLSAFEANNIMIKYHTTFSNEKANVLAPLLESDVLFVDDLGTEPVINNVTTNYLFLVLSERERFGKATIISTNLLPKNIENRYGERIYSRLFNKLDCAVFKVDGNDLRRKQ